MILQVVVSVQHVKDDLAVLAMVSKVANNNISGIHAAVHKTFKSAGA